jgi:hypothetical protein
MNESNCNCSCQYSTPPWWVTMGFIPPAAGQSLQHIVPVTGGQTTVTHPVVPVTTNPVTGTHPGGIGSVLGTVGNALGNTVGTIVGTPLNVAGNVLSDVVNGIGGVIGSIF